MASVRVHEPGVNGAEVPPELTGRLDGFVDRARHAARAFRELGQERIATRTVVNDVRVPEARVQPRRSRNALQSPVDRRNRVDLRLVRPRLEIWLVDLYHIGARLLERTQLGVDRRR